MFSSWAFQMYLTLIYLDLFRNVKCAINYICTKPKFSKKKHTRWNSWPFYFTDTKEQIKYRNVMKLLIECTFKDKTQWNVILIISLHHMVLHSLKLCKTHSVLLQKHFPNLCPLLILFHKKQKTLDFKMWRWCKFRRKPSEGTGFIGPGGSCAGLRGQGKCWCERWRTVVMVSRWRAQVWSPRCQGDPCVSGLCKARCSTGRPEPGPRWVH